MKTIFTALSFAILLLCSLRSSAQGFAALKIGSFHNYDIMTSAFDRSAIGVLSEVGFETFNASYQLELGIYVPRQADSLMEIIDTTLGYYYDAQVNETISLYSIGLEGRYYLFSDWLETNRIFTNSGIICLFEHAKQDVDHYGIHEIEKFTNKNFLITFGLGYELVIDNEVMPFIELMGHFPITEAEQAGTTIYDLTNSFGLRVNAGVKLYLGS